MPFEEKRTNSWSDILEKTSIEGVLLCLDDTVIKCNNRALALLGYTREQLSAVPVHNIIPDKCFQQLEQSGNNSVTGCLAELTRNDGSVFAAHVRAGFIQLPEGMARLVHFFDYEGLGLVERRFKEIYDITPNAVIKVAPDGKLIAANKAGAIVLGFGSPEEVVAAGVYVGKYLCDPAQGHAFLKMMHQQKDITSYAFKVKNPGNQRKLWLEVSAAPFYSGTGELQHYEAIVRDVTASKVMEIYLKNEKSRLNAVFNAIPGPVLLIDPEDSFVVDCNESARYTFGDIKGQSCHLGCFSRDEQFPVSRLINVGDSRIALSYWQCCDKDGKSWTVYDVPFLNIDGSPLSLKFMLDISSRVEYEGKLKEARALAEQANQAKSDFLANMSHEIRTPLNGVLGTLQLLQDDGLTEQQQQYVSIATESGKNLLSLINSILDISRVDAGKLEVQYVKMNPALLFETTISLCIPDAEKKGISLKFEAHSSLPDFVEADQERIRQILFNLLGNAIKFSDGGMIEVSVMLLPQVRENGNRVLYFVVEDCGVGIPPFLVEQAFDVFSQVDGSYSRRHQGAGLGLGIVKRLVTLLGGTIAVDSDGESGTAIHVTVGVREINHELAVEADERQGAVDGFDFSDLKILLAEDEVINRTIAIAMLEKMGAEVVDVPDGNKALEELEKNNFDLVLMDIQMPECSGIDVTRMIRKDKRFSDKADLPVIAMTAHAMDGDRETFLKAGMDAYVAKPFEKEELRQTIVTVLTER